MNDILSRLTFDEKKHKYFLDGKPIPGVTSITGRMIRKIGIERWRESVGTAAANKRLKEGGAIGTAIHDLCEAVNHQIVAGQNIMVDTDDEMVYNAVQGYVWWAMEKIGDIKYIEQKVASEKYMYGGKCDLVAKVDGGEGYRVIDIKSGTYRPEADTGLQVAAYDHALTEMGLVDELDNPIALHVKRDGSEVEAIEFKDPQGDFEAFVHFRAAYEWVQRRKLK